MKKLAEMYNDLHPDLKRHDLDSSCPTDSSLDSTPSKPEHPSSFNVLIIVTIVERPNTPLGAANLTTLFSLLVGGGAKRASPISKSPVFGTSPPRPSSLRTSDIDPIPLITDFQIIKPISRGAYGKVYLARKKTTDDLYAIKVLKKHELIKKNMISHVLAERRVMSLLQAPFVVMLYYAFESSEHLFLVMEYLIGGDLSSIIQDRGRLREEEACFYTAEIVQALEHLHEHGIIHRDIKPDNLLLDANGHLKLSDFGLAIPKARAKGGEERVLGTPDYLAPELILGQDHGTAVDWWALGVCLYEFLVGFPPFTGETPEIIFKNISSNTKTVDWEAVKKEIMISDSAQDLIDKLLDPDPNSRLGSEGIKAHPFFAPINWSLLRKAPAPIIPKATDHMDTSSFAARNRRYSSIDVLEEFSEAEPVQEMRETFSGYSSPSKLTTRRTASPFDGFGYKNIDLLSKVNRKLSSTPLSMLSPLADGSKSCSESQAASDPDNFGLS